jgi:hypothetical protein
MDRPEVTVARWTATIHYRTEAGLVDVTHDLIELDELQDVVERGPHWDAIAFINIVRSDGADQKLTVEQAAKL